MKKKKILLWACPSTWLVCVRKTVFHGEELSRCLELVQVLLRYGGDSFMPILIGTGFCAISHGCWTRAVR